MLPMNARLPRSETVLRSRAHLSPIGRYRNHRAAEMTTPRFNLPAAATATLAGSPFWSLNVIDRLQAPLTRYHD